MALPLDPPRPSDPWHDAQYVPKAISPRAASPVVFAAYEGGFVPSRIPLRPQRENIPLVIMLICSSVSNPPALCAHAGIEVPRTTETTTLSPACYSTWVVYPGLAGAMVVRPPS